ncbi:hypothetical protein CLV58_109134 [Spirosoma oryzae]|uniref:Uncharacterized protein n=1 Tax=Spirosoma oryzae TaxID=1469603 RepID=A0A2T0SYC4_9BACT|nr:hypothetical protein [Spirosoma oryzae]PRY38407.1 hypothetical protein CLV58_109134 [Spirosoma oryzae]
MNPGNRLRKQLVDLIQGRMADNLVQAESAVQQSRYEEVVNLGSRNQELQWVLQQLRRIPKPNQV